MYNEKSRKNLKKFTSEYQPKKKGRPKGSVSLTNEIKKVLESVDENSQKSVAELFATAVLKQAMKGNPACLKEVMERVDGKVTDKIEHTGKDRGPLTFKVVYVDKKLEDD